MLVECSPTVPPSKATAAESPWRFWLWPNFLSLDAPLVAVLWQVLLTRELAVQVKPGEPVVLALCVWLVYVADRVLDALHPLIGDWEPARKSFYRRHLRIAAIAGLCMLSTIIPLAYFILRRSTFYAGLTLAVPLLFYFALIHLSPVRWRARWPRELVVACLFTSGTFLAIWQRNVLSEDSAPSHSTRWAARYLTVVGVVIACVAVLIGYLALAPIGFAAAALLSGIALALLARWRLHLPMNALRVSVDLALCTPVLTLLFLPAK